MAQITKRRARKVRANGPISHSWSAPVSREGTYHLSIGEYYVALTATEAAKLAAKVISRDGDKVVEELRAIRTLDFPGDREREEQRLAKLADAIEGARA